MTKDFADFDPSIEPQAEAPQHATTGLGGPSADMDFAGGPSTIATDDVCKCGAARSQKNVERCLRGHPMPGAVIHPHKRGSISVRRVEQLEAAFIEDYKPQTRRQRMEVSRLARMWELRERMERFEAGSIEHQRLDQIIRELVDRIESSRPEPRGADGASSGAVVILPDNHRQWDQRVEHGDDLLRELLPQPAPPEPPAPQLDAPQPAPAPPIEHTIVEPYRDGPVSGLRRRAVTEDEVVGCLAASGDLSDYRAGRLSKDDAQRMTAAWLKASREFPR
jgi:hypothetical protein